MVGNDKIVGDRCKLASQIHLTSRKKKAEEKRDCHVLHVLAEAKLQSELQ